MRVYSPSTYSPAKMEVNKSTEKLTSTLPPHQRKTAQEEKQVTHHSSAQNTRTSNPINLPNLLDAILRGTFRYIETAKISNNAVRVPFRLITETVRYGGTDSIQSLLKNKEIGKEVWFNSLRRALENTAATIVFEPNQHTNRVARMAVGFANMAIRFSARVGLAALNIISPESVEIENLTDEFLGRSIGRVVCSASTNPVVGIGARSAEQLLINSWLSSLPIKNYFSTQKSNCQT